jgi:hypothetical protein
MSQFCQPSANLPLAMRTMVIPVTLHTFPVAGIPRPVHSYVNLRERGPHPIEDRIESLGAAHAVATVVKDGVGRQELSYCLAPQPSNASDYCTQIGDDQAIWSSTCITRT